MKFSYRILAVVCLVAFTVQCEVVDSDLLNDPNNVSPENVDPDFLLNNIQLNARDIYRAAADIGGEMTRMKYMFGSNYQNAYSPQSFNGIYQNAYADLYIDASTLVPIAQNRSLYAHSGIAKVLKAYTMITMVDMFGDLPLADALQGAGNFNPGLTNGQAIYDSALTLLDSGIADLTNADRLAFPESDLYFGVLDDEGDQEAAWVRTANTIKLKAYLNMGDIAAIDALLASGVDLIDEDGEEFTFDYSTNTTNPDSRHPDFAGNYVDQAGDYMAINYLNMMLNDKPDAVVDEDPRIRYYFYRQTTDDPVDVNLNTCINAPKPPHFQPNDPWCLLGDGWWGRDHLINDGIPPDGDLRTTYGVYPAGGRFDNGQGESTEEDMGLQGAGFEPMLMSWYTEFMLAEAAELGATNTNTADAHLTEALNQSFDFVLAYGESQATGTFNEPAQAEVDDYINEVVNNRFPGAPMRTIIKEYYLALWPNGYEAYNAMRRQGFPDRADNLQPARTATPGDWYRSLLYPANLVERNSSVPQKDSRLTRVFWDTRGADDEYNF